MLDPKEQAKGGFRAHAERENARRDARAEARREAGAAADTTADVPAPVEAVWDVVRRVEQRVSHRPIWLQLDREEQCAVDLDYLVQQWKWKRQRRIHRFVDERSRQVRNADDC